MLFDLHIHSTYSDGRMSPEQIINFAADKKIGVSITDHNEIRGSILGKNIADKKSVDFLLGIELGTNEGKEILFYFSNPEYLEKFYIKEIEPFKTKRMTRINRPMSDFLYKPIKKKYDVFFTSYPHPYGPLYKSIEHLEDLSQKLLDFCDCIEVVNGHISDKSNIKAIELAKKINKPVTAGSDAHLLKNIGSILIDFNFDFTQNKIENIYSGLFQKKRTISTLVAIAHANFKHSFLKKGISG